MNLQLIPTNETLYGAARQHAIDHQGLVNRKAFEVNIGLFTALAIVTLAIRIIIRMKNMGRILLDDYFLIFATLCLTTCMGLLYWQVGLLYFLQALQKIPTKIIPTMDEVLRTLDVNKRMQIFMSLNWTAIFAVKFSFLAYFSKLIQNISPKFKTYFWCVIAFTIASWAFMTGSNFIGCPYFGKDISKFLNICAHASMPIKMLSITTAVDVVTDILVISFPIIIIHQARMSRQRKIALGTVLSLSLAMVVIAIMRLVGSVLVKGVVIVDQKWEFFWQQLEASIAVMMGALAALRGAFNRGNDRGDAEAEDAPHKWWRQ